MKVIARRCRGLSHQVEIEGGHELIVDEPTEAGGTDAGPSPTRLLAASLAACTAITMEIYAERKGIEIGPVKVSVELSYEGSRPALFAVCIELSGGLSEDQRERLLAIARKCPVHTALATETAVTVTERR